MIALILIHLLALAGAVLIYIGEINPLLKDTLWKSLFFSYNWWGTYFLVKWITKRMKKKNNKRSLFEIYLNPLGWKLLLIFRNAEYPIIERGSFFAHQGVPPCLDPPTEANYGS
jgi:hypothetical protein